MSTISQGEGTSRRILIVEDEAMEAAIVTEILRRAGYDTTHVADPLEAARRVETERFDIIISDFLMPQMNGLQVLRRVRYHLPESVRIILTSKRDFDVAVDAINRGEVFRFLKKPVDERELLMVLRIASERMSLVEELARLKKELAERDEALDLLRKASAERS